MAAFLVGSNQLIGHLPERGFAQMTNMLLVLQNPVGIESLTNPTYPPRKSSTAITESSVACYAQSTGLDHDNEQTPPWQCGAKA
eukprot:4688016-Amphidinium_carterae.1